MLHGTQSSNLFQTSITMISSISFIFHQLQDFTTKQCSMPQPNEIPKGETVGIYTSHCTYCE